mmetsp:Transcript_24749/g.80959  ORF Transcript_24749/g.80959 Transcript_24749/m.80959 type:complete len:214 (+) Transcript_24749:670-1311(+)
MPPRIDAPPAAAAAVLDERRVRRHDLARVRGVQHVRVRVGVVRARQEPRRRPASHAARVLVASRLPAGHVHLLPRAGVPHAELQLSHSVACAGLRGGGVEQLRQRGRLAGRPALHVLDIVLEHGGGVDADALEARVAPRGEAPIRISKAPGGKPALRGLSLTAGTGVCGEVSTGSLGGGSTRWRLCGPSRARTLRGPRDAPSQSGSAGSRTAR